MLINTSRLRPNDAVYTQAENEEVSLVDVVVCLSESTPGLTQFHDEAVAGQGDVSRGDDEFTFTLIKDVVTPLNVVWEIGDI